MNNRMPSFNEKINKYNNWPSGLLDLRKDPRSKSAKLLLIEAVDDIESDNSYLGELSDSDSDQSVSHLEPDENEQNATDAKKNGGEHGKEKNGNENKARQSSDSQDIGVIFNKKHGQNQHYHSNQLSESR